MDKLPTTVTTSLGKTLHLSRQIGKGGEGAVFETREQPDVAAKLYWPKNAATRHAKVAAMASAGWSKTNPIVAFPIDVLFASNGTFAGYLMKKVGGHKPVHLLYSPGSRKAEFQKAQFPFLVRAAQNIARAVASVHATGCVIGDVNHSGFLVSEAATSVLIDSDSFQFIAANKNFFCQVGTPEYTPAEMQGAKFDRVQRTSNHDNFGLAVLIFQLLFLGKHPFAGRYSGSGDMPLERAIREFRFAYSKSQNGMQPPPGAPLLSDFPDQIGQYFEQAFGKSGVTNRPSATSWIAALQALESDLQRCSADANHHHVTGKPCPWCRMEAQNPGFVAFSSLSSSSSDPAAVDVNGLLSVIRSIPDPGLPPDLQSLIALPTTLVPTQVTSAVIRQLKKRAAVAIGATASGTILVAIGGSLILPGCILIAAGIGSGFIEPDALKGVRKSRLSSQTAWRNVEAAWKQTGNEKFHVLKSEAEGLIKSLRELPNEQKQALAELERKKRDLQLTRFLDGFRIADAKIRKIGSARKALLASYGIETAADVSQSRIESVQGFGGFLATNLVAWRDGIARRFIFNVSEPLNPQDLSALKQRLLQKRQDIEKRLRIAASGLKQTSASSLEQRKKLTGSAEHVIRSIRQSELDEKACTGPSYQASRIGPFVFAGVAAFFLFQSGPTTTRASYQPVANNTSSTLPWQVPATATPTRRALAQTTAPGPNQSARFYVPRPKPDQPQPQSIAPGSSSTAADMRLPPALGLPPAGASAPPTTSIPPLPPPIDVASLPGGKSDVAGVAQPGATSDSDLPVASLELSRSADAIKIQNRLISLGYLGGIADGKWGPASKRALQQFRLGNGISSTEAWDVTTEQRLFGTEVGSHSMTASFAGSWTNEIGECGNPGDRAPLSLTLDSATTSVGDTCRFGSVQSAGDNSWRMTATCTVGGRTHRSNVRLTLSGQSLKWTSENGEATYYRCQ